MDITESISEFLSKNQFASGGLLLGAAGALAASLRSYPSRIWNWGKSKCFITVEVLGKDEIYSWFEKWLSAHEYSAKSMRLTAWSTPSDPVPFYGYPPPPSKEEIEEFRRLLERAREYDKRNSEPECETESKKKRLLDLAEQLGVKIDFL